MNECRCGCGREAKAGFRGLYQACYQKLRRMNMLYLYPSVAKIGRPRGARLHWRTSR